MKVQSIDLGVASKERPGGVPGSNTALQAVGGRVLALFRFQVGQSAFGKLGWWSLCATAICAGCSHSAPAPDATDETPKPVVEVSLAHTTVGDISSIVKVTGTVSPLPDQEAKVTPLEPGRIKDVLVKTGDRVSKGQVIATLDASVAQAQVHQSEAAVRVAQSTLQQARVNYTSQTRLQTSAVQQARTNLQAQRVALDKLRAGSRPQEVAQAQVALTSAQAALTNAEASLRRAQTLFSEGLLARKDLEEAQTEEKTAKATVQSAELSLSLAKQGNRPEDIRSGVIAVQQAQDALTAALSQSIQNASKAQDVRIAAGELQSANAALETSRLQANALTIVSPLDGTVVGRTVNAGESVDVTSAIATIVNLHVVRLLLNVPADQAPSIRSGQSVQFTIDSDPGSQRLAKVTVVNASVDSTTNSVVVEAISANPDGKLRDDGFVRGGIVTDVHRGVVLVPTAALVDKDDKTVAYTVGSDDVAREQELELGFRSETQVEIKKGLKSGDAVVTTGAYELDDGTQVKVGK